MPRMKPKTLYLVLCIAGVLLPYSQFVPWVMQHGLNLTLFARELFSTRIGAFFGMDVLVSAVALLVFTRIESARLGIRHRWSESRWACRYFSTCESARPNRLP
jgi:hypothetical protein